MKKTLQLNKCNNNSRTRETLNISTDANESTDTEKKNIQGFFFFFRDLIWRGWAAVNFTAEHRSTFLSIELHCIYFPMLCTSLKSFKNICSFNSQQFNSLDCIELHCIANFWLAVHCNVLDCTAPLTLGRRESLITKFALKTFHSPKFNSWFSKQQQKEVNTRSSKQFLKEVPTRTKRYGNSTIPVITKIINTNYSENHEEKYCNICDKLFKTGNNLTKHIKFKHSKDTCTPQYTSRVTY